MLGRLALLTGASLGLAGVPTLHAAEALYDFNETSGRIAKDASGNGHHGRPYNVVRGKAGYTGQLGDYAYHFNGSSAVVRVPNAASLRPGERDVDAVLHIKTSGCRQIAPSDCDLIKYGASSDPSPAGLGHVVKMELLPDGTIDCGFSGTKGHYDLKGGPKVATNSWQEIVCRKTGTQIMLLVDGIVRNSHSVTVGDINPVRDLFIGASGRDGNADWSYGTLDKVALIYTFPK